MKKNTNQIPLVGERGRKMIINQVKGLSEDIKQVAENSVSPDNDSLTEKEQMAVRKNLGLYYEETTEGEKTVAYNGQSQSESVPYYAKLSDDVPAKEDIISCCGKTGNELNITDFSNIDGYEITILPAGLTTAHFKVIGPNNTIGAETGIYFDLDVDPIDNSANLVYHAQVTTVSKIDAKFLPEQESGIEPVTLLQVPNQSLESITRSDYISDEDWNKLISGETVVAKCDTSIPGLTGYQYFLCVVAVSTIGTPSSVDVQFIGNNTKFNINQLGTAYTLKYYNLNGIYNVSDFPTDGMTSQEIEQLGFKNSDLPLLGNEFKAISHGGEIATIISSYAVGMLYTVEFWSKNNKYVMTGTFMSNDLSCTVTPR